MGRPAGPRAWRSGARVACCTPQRAADALRFRGGCSPQAQGSRTCAGHRIDGCQCPGAVRFPARASTTVKRVPVRTPGVETIDYLALFVGLEQDHERERTANEDGRASED